MLRQRVAEILMKLVLKASSCRPQEKNESPVYEVRTISGEVYICKKVFYKRREYHLLVERVVSGEKINVEIRFRPAILLTILRMEREADRLLLIASKKQVIERVM